MIAIAYAALLLWPLVVWKLFQRLRAADAATWSLVGGYMLLPQSIAIDLPVLPAFDRNLAASLPVTLLLGLTLANAEVARGGASRPALIGPKGWVPTSWLIRAMIAATLVGPMVTTLTNRAPLHYGPLTIQGMGPYDALSAALDALMSLLPLLIARRCIATAEQQRSFLRIFTIAALCYTVPMLVEIRFAPQLQSWIYGDASFGMGQQVRYGWFRPVVFMQHGLWLALFVAMSVCAGAALLKYAGSARNRALAAFGWLMLMLLACRSIGALVLGIVFTPIILLFAWRPRAAVSVAAVFATMALIYPALRGLDLIPTEAIVAKVAEFDDERARSLRTRFDNEDLYLGHASEKPLTGWGGWSRWRVFDTETGEDITVSDGAWIIIFGSWGWVGYFGIFGMLCAPILLIFFRRRSPALSAESGVLCLMLAMNLLDMLLNGTRTPITYMLCGALIGHAELMLRGLPTSTAAAEAREGPAATGGVQEKPRDRVSVGHARRGILTDPKKRRTIL